MKTIGFIGAYDKTDLLLNVAKILTTMQNKVLVIDSTINQKAKYVVPAIDPTVSYITSFEDIDVAIGFNSIEEVKKYMGVITELPYDYLLVDTDTEQKVEGFRLETADKNFFVTAFDMYSLKRGMEVLSQLRVPMPLTKILYSTEILKEDDEYLDFISLGYKVIWQEERIYFPLDNNDFTAIAENQRVQKIKFKKLSIQYKDALSVIIQQILNQENDSNIRRAIKIIERGV